MSRSNWWCTRRDEAARAHACEMAREARRRAVLEQVAGGARTVETIWLGINWWTKDTVREAIRELVVHGRLKKLDEVPG